MGNKYRQDWEFIYWLRLGIVLICKNQQENYK